ncbi:SGNH/GDSL hydrolase family protein [Aquimarina sp. MMG016]|uniref:SGNH/GDSL hydrolase family protein n=1 Tax=Aquimarina sp. MMG016 TaxID=2822690 RepID=UPI001B3A1457|nr:SGNH/GDSL hydrolase family protein [Aquimarina sp. MMG016]MBQ4820151.1 SGNH/GDSL hydrolase family protein [Aquimarina sp. MMG016]
MFSKTLSFIYIILFICLACSDDVDIVFESVEPPIPEEVKNFSFLALGDSYTIGQGVGENDSWPFQLKNRTETEDQKIDKLTIIAKTGWTTKNLLNAIETENPPNHDLVTLLIGVNNQFQGIDFSIFQTEFDLLLDKAITLANSNKNVIVVSIPDYGVTPFGADNSEIIAQELDNYNIYIQQRCIANQVSFVDITTISRELGDSEMALANDNLHPSGFQYSKWVEKILPLAKEILQ